MRAWCWSRGCLRVLKHQDLVLQPQAAINNFIFGHLDMTIACMHAMGMLHKDAAALHVLVLVYIRLTSIHIPVLSCFVLTQL